MILNNLAKAYAESGQYEQAEEMAREAVRIAEKTQNTHLSQFMANLGVILNLEGNYILDVLTRTSRPHYAVILKVSLLKYIDQMFSVHTANPQQSPLSLNLCLRNTRSGKSRDYRDVIAFEKLCLKMLSVHTKTKSRRFQITPVWNTFSKISL